MSDYGQCPLCGAEAVNQDIEFAPGVCTDCGFVVKNDGQPADLDQSVLAEDSESSPSLESFSGEHQVVKVRDSSEQNLVELLSMTEALGETLSVPPDAQIRAGEIATEAWRRKILHGRSMDAGASGALHIACRELGCPRPVRVIADAVEIDPSKVNNMYQFLIDTLEIELDTPQPIDFVQFICDSLGYSDDKVTAAEKLLQNQSKTIAGNPAGIAAGAVYVALQDTAIKSEITYREIAQPIKMTKETVWRKSSEIQQMNQL